jgi:hypothetical protein
MLATQQKYVSDNGQVLTVQELGENGRVTIDIDGEVRVFENSESLTRFMQENHFDQVNTTVEDVTADIADEIDNTLSQEDGEIGDEPVLDPPASMEDNLESEETMYDDEEDPLLSNEFSSFENPADIFELPDEEVGTDPVNLDYSDEEDDDDIERIDGMQESDDSEFNVNIFVGSEQEKEIVVSDIDSDEEDVEDSDSISDELEDEDESELEDSFPSIMTKDDIAGHDPYLMSESDDEEDNDEEDNDEEDNDEESSSGDEGSLELDVDSDEDESDEDESDEDESDEDESDGDSDEDESDEDSDEDESDEDSDEDESDEDSDEDESDEDESDGDSDEDESEEDESDVDSDEDESEEKDVNEFLSKRKNLSKKNEKFSSFKRRQVAEQRNPKGTNNSEEAALKRLVSMVS